MVTTRKKHSSIRRPLSLGEWVGQRRVAQLKVRLPEPLRRDLERAAAGAGHSMNTEIVRRLSESFKDYGRAKLIAESLLKDLDQEVQLEMFSKFIRDRAARNDVGKRWAKLLRDQATADDDDGEPK